MKAMSAGLISIDEARDEIGYDPMDAADDDGAAAAEEAYGKNPR